MLKIHTSRDEETISKPWFEEPVFGRFVNVHVTGEDHLNIAWIDQENHQFRTNPQPDDIAVFERPFVDILEDCCNEGRVEINSLLLKFYQTFQLYIINSNFRFSTILK